MLWPSYQPLSLGLGQPCPAHTESWSPLRPPSTPIRIFPPSGCLHEAESPHPHPDLAGQSAREGVQCLGSGEVFLSQALTHPGLVSSSFLHKSTRMPLEAGFYLCLRCPFLLPTPHPHRRCQSPTQRSENSSAVTIWRPFLTQSLGTPTPSQAGWALLLREFPHSFTPTSWK